LHLSDGVGLVHSSFSFGHQEGGIFFSSYGVVVGLALLVVLRVFSSFLVGFDPLSFVFGHREEWGLSILFLRCCFSFSNDIAYFFLFFFAGLLVTFGVSQTIYIHSHFLIYYISICD